MRYYLDTEFLEGTQKSFFGKTKPTIDLISIGIVSEGGKEYYAISKDFNLKEAWNRYDVVTEQVYGDLRNIFPEGRKKKVYWIRENILKPIFKDLWFDNCHLQNLHHCSNDFTYRNLKKLINLYGKSNEKISQEIKKFVYDTSDIHNPDTIANWDEVKHLFPLEFYTYYGDYDWVVFCWLFGKMIDLPKGFPMYSKDLKQILDDKLPEPKLSEVKLNPFSTYPKNPDEHNALADAHWNRSLHTFLENLE